MADETTVSEILRAEVARRRKANEDRAIRERIAALTEDQIEWLQDEITGSHLPLQVCVRNALVALLAPEAPNGK